MKAQSLHFPWASALGSLTVVSYLYSFTQPDLIAFYQVPDSLFQSNIQLLVMCLYFVILLIDARKFYKLAKIHELSTSKLNDQINELLIAKKKLQNKAHTFAGHADKLKLFISDRLLEYIEYDEKFLHFKSIASEVRHNGVICFDKVQTALSHAIEYAEIEDEEIYQDAYDSMVYLWDLLELSTTDNLALHISNQLCECEEHYYQSLLKDDVLSNDLAPPTFSAKSAVIKAVNPFLDPPLDVRAVADEFASPLTLREPNFWLNIENTKQLLGNENHIVLLIENLVNNAVFYAGKRQYAHKDARIAVELHNYDGNIRYSIYNHGPHINEDEKDQIFQLGYSTRRVREHNGKGLGLYFVNEIIKGYEGSISFNNIHNREDIYSIRIEFTDDTVITDVIETRLRDAKVACKRSNEDTLGNTVEWTDKQHVLSIEVSSQATHETYSLVMSNDHPNRFLDPEDTAMPRWVIEVTERKRSNKITFTPLDINGVCFFVDLPSAESRLDYSDTLDDYGDTGEQDLDSLRENFMDPDTFNGKAARSGG
jgi:signal transduction histidine kinase